MKFLPPILGLASYILIVNNTHLIYLHRLYKGDSYEFAQAAISIGACVVFVAIQKLFKSTAALYYFRGLNLTHVAVFLLTTYISLTLLSLELDFVYLIITVLVFAIIEQYIVFAQISRFYGTKKFFFVFVAVYLVFIFGHGFSFSIPNIVSALFLIPTLYRTIVDRNIWHGVIFHYTYNIATISGLDRSEVNDTVLLMWFVLMLIYWVLLIFTADNARPAAARMLSRVFRGNAGASIAAFLTVLCRFPIYLLQGVSCPVDSFFIIKNNIKLYADVRYIRRHLKRGKGVKIPQRFSGKIVEGLELRTVVFWHTDGYLFSIINLLQNNINIKGDLIVLRRIQDSYFEQTIELICSNSRRKVHFIHNAGDLRMLQQSHNVDQMIWVFGGEFLVSQTPAAKMMLRKLISSTALTCVHRPWMPHAKDHWAYTATPTDELDSARTEINKLRSQRLIPGAGIVADDIPA